MSFVGGSQKKKHYMEDAMQFTDSIGVIADGHSKSGMIGKDIATFACKQLISKLHVDSQYDPEQYYDSIPTIFQEIHYNYRDIMPSKESCGTTLTCAVIGTFKDHPYIMTANVGDSDAYLFVKKGTTYSWKQLTTTHRPTSEAEYFRIQTYRDLAGHCMYDVKGAHAIGEYLPIFNDDGTMIYYQDTYAPVEKSIAAYNTARHAYLRAMNNADKIRLKESALDAYTEYKKCLAVHEESVDGRRIVSTASNDRASYLVSDLDNIKLSVTRSIGNYHASMIGVTYQPAVSITWLDKEDLGDRAVLFMATDGITDCYRMEDLIQTVMESDPHTLRSQFAKKAESIFGNEYDDMTYLLKTIK